MALLTSTISDSVSVTDSLTASRHLQRTTSESVVVSDAISAVRIESLVIDNVRALTGTRVRIDFSAAALVNDALTSVSSYSFANTSPGSVEIFPLAVRLPPGQVNPLYVELDVTEHTDGADYEVTLSSELRGAAGEIGNPIPFEYQGVGTLPLVTLVLATSATETQVVFSEPMADNAAVNDPANYEWDNGLLTLAVKSAIGNVVTLQTTEQTPGVLYTLTVIGVDTRYVNSVTGNDANDGATPSTPFRTLARAMTGAMDSTTVILLAKGSRFREELTGLPPGARVRAYGSGARPIIDARDIAINAAFSKTGGQTNVYQISWAHGFGVDGGKSAHRVWEAGEMMARAASLAACDSTPGSFYAAAPTDGGPDTVYFHPSDSSNPILNDREYQLTKRRWAVQLYTSYLQAHVTGLETTGNSYADGSLCIDGYVEDCVARDGRIHNAFILGEAVGCQAFATEAGVNSTMFVTYKDASSFGPNGRNTLFRNCLADAQASMTGVSGYYMHTDGVHLFGTIEYRDCRAVGCDSGWGGIQAAKVVAYRCTYEDVINAFSFVGVENFILGGTGKTRGGFFDGGLVYANTGAEVEYTIRGCKVLQHSGFGPVFLYLTGGTAIVERCTFTTDVGGLIRNFRGQITFRRNVVAYGNVNCTQLHYFTDPIDGYDTDYNCYWNPVNMDGAFQYLYPTPTTINTLVGWRAYLASQALGAGRDAHSIAQDPNIPGYLDLDFTIENEGVLAMGCGAEVDEEDDAELQALWAKHRVGGVNPDLYVDDVDGDDDNNDGSHAAPYKTLARALEDELASGTCVWLKRDSLFREELTDLPPGVQVRAYGFGERPIVDARDIASNASFSKTSGRTNVYQISWAHGFGADGGKSAHRIWEDDGMLARVADLATCDSTPGSFYAAAPTSGPDVIYMHASDSSNPVANGKDYALTKRRWAVQLYESYKQAYVVGLEAIGNSHADGSLCIDGYVEDCVARDGRIHNAFILGEAVAVQAIGQEVPGGTMFISYVDSGPTFGGPAARNVLYRDCVAEIEDATATVIGFYSHTDFVREFATIEYRDCRVVGCAAGWGGGNAQKIVAYRCTYDDVQAAFGCGGTENFFLGGSGKIRAGSFLGGLAYLTAVVPGFSFVIRGCKVYAAGNYTSLNISTPGSAVEVSRCTFTGPGTSVVQLKLGDTVFRNNVLSGGAPLWIGTAGAQIEGYDTDDNCYWIVAWSDGLMGSDYPTHVDYFFDGHIGFPGMTWLEYLDSVALGSGTDDNSIVQDPLIADPENLDFSIGNATVVGMGAGAEVDEEDDPELQAYWIANRVTEV